MQKSGLLILLLLTCSRGPGLIIDSTQFHCRLHGAAHGRGGNTVARAL